MLVALALAAGTFLECLIWFYAAMAAASLVMVEVRHDR